MSGRGKSRRGGRQKRGLKEMFGGGGGSWRRRPLDDDDRMAEPPRYDDDEGASPQSTGCFGTRRRDSRRRGRGGGGISRGLLGRLGLPVAGQSARRHEQRRHDDANRSTAGGATWNRVLVQQGRSFGKEFIVKSLSNYVDGDFVPQLFRYTEQGDVLFYLEDNDVAEAVKAANRRISEPKSGKKMIMVLSKAPLPYTPVSAADEALIKAVLAKRYDTATHCLNLSKFPQDPDFAGHDEYMSLQRTNVLACVVRLIAQHCGATLRGLDLSDNRLRFLEYLGALVYSAKHVQSLKLSRNQIHSINELDKLRGWPLVELQLYGNPLFDNFADTDTYSRAVHRVFPKVALLDEEPVQAEISFGIEEHVEQKKQLPPYLTGFMLNDEVRRLVETFIDEYLTLYDAADPAAGRKQLLAAYDDDATFTLSMTPVDVEGRYSDRELFMEYRRDSHNVCFVEQWERYRAKLVHRGAINVVARLCRLPRTQHLRHTLLVDVAFAAGNVLSFTLQGLLRDGDLAGTESDELRFFARNFLVVSRGQGRVAVVNEQLFLTPLAPSQARVYVSQLQRANAAAPATAAASPAALPSTSAAAAAAATETHEQLTERFARDSGMKADWAAKCLVDHDWNFDAAAAVFLQMKQQNLIPAEAFA